MEEGSAENELDKHRPFVRDLNQKMANVFGFGGLVVAFSIIIVFWLTTDLWSLTAVTPWVLTLSWVIVGLFILRSVVHRRAGSVLDRFESYCEANDLEEQKMYETYHDESLFPFFSFAIEMIERRKRLGDDDE